jgi:Ser/Thr protein kinase RdoA (MazF antagonist)
VPAHDRLRSRLRDHWHLRPDRITHLATGVLSRTWAVTAGAEAYVARLIDANGRQPFEAGMVAGEHLRASGIAAGRPLRTLGGALTVATPAGALAVLHHVPGRALAGDDPDDQRMWGERLGTVHRLLQHVSPHVSPPEQRAWAVQADRWARNGDRAGLARAHAALAAMPS